MRVIRILVYEGDPDKITETMKQNAVKQFHQIGSDLSGMTITEAIIGYKYPSLEDQFGN